MYLLQHCSNGTVLRQASHFLHLAGRVHQFGARKTGGTKHCARYLGSWHLRMNPVIQSTQKIKSVPQLAGWHVCVFYGLLLMQVASAQHSVETSLDETEGLPHDSIDSSSAVQRQYFLTICAIFKNEAMGIDEWLQHHLLEGVDHFFLVDQGSTDEYMPIIQPYIDAGQVTLMLNPRKHSQMAVLENYFFPLHDVTSWMMHIDLDEFMYARQGTISAYLAQLPHNTAFVQVLWKGYGSSGHRVHPSGSIVKNFRLRGNETADFGKVVFRPSLAASMAVHGITVKSGIHVNNIYLQVGDICGTDERCIAGAAQHAALQINHYNIKSLEHFIRTKMSRGDVNSDKLEHGRNFAYFEGYDQIGSDIADLDLYYKHQELFDSL